MLKLGCQIREKNVREKQKGKISLQEHKSNSQKEKKHKKYQKNTDPHFQLLYLWRIGGLFMVGEPVRSLYQGGNPEPVFLLAVCVKVTEVEWVRSLSV